MIFFSPSETIHHHHCRLWRHRSFLTSSVPLLNATSPMHTIIGYMPNGTTIQSLHHGQLTLGTPGVSIAHILPHLSHSLLSIGKLCDTGCQAIFDAKTVTIKHNNKSLLHGTRDVDGLYKLIIPTSHPHRITPVLPSPPTVNHQANFSVYDGTTHQIIRFLHFGSLLAHKINISQSTEKQPFCRMAGPGLSTTNVTRYLTLSVPTILGHMDQQRQDTRSTKIKAVTTQPTEIPNPDGQVKTHQAFLNLSELPSGRIYTDLTGSFPVVSAQGIKSVMVLYDYDSNFILVEGITSHNHSELLRAFTALLGRLKLGGVVPQIQRVDNEVSQSFKDFLQNNNISLELTPAHVHRRNAAERAIRTWKNHFIAGMASLNPRFPIRYWSHLLPQSESTLNLLRQSRINPKLSAYAQLNGQFDYDKTPIAPPGCKVIAFNPPSQRTSWGYHAGFKAWYAKPAMNHYRCVRAISETTGRETTVETVQYFPHNFAMPALSSRDLTTKAAHDLTQALQNPHPAAPFLRPNAHLVSELKRLAIIFAEMANPKHTMCHLRGCPHTTNKPLRQQERLPRLSTSTTNFKKS